MPTPREQIYLVNTVFDLSFGVLGLILLAAVWRPGRRLHLPWAVPGAIGLFLTGLYRIVFDLRQSLGWHISLYAIIPILFLSDAIGIVGCYRLWKLLDRLPPMWIRSGYRSGHIPILKKKRKKIRRLKARPSNPTPPVAPSQTARPPVFSNSGSKIQLHND